MPQKNILPEHDPAPTADHSRLIAGEAPNFLILSYLPNQEYGYQRLIHFNHAGDSTGYIDLPSEPNQPGRNPHYTNLDQLAEIPEPHYLSHQLSTHNDHIRRIVKNDLSQHEVNQLIKAEKQKLAEANKPKVLTLDEEREARNYRATACREADHKAKQTHEKLRQLHHWQVRANGYKQQVDDLIALGGNQAMIDSQKVQYERFQALYDTNHDEYHANHEQAIAEAKAAYAKTAREYYEEAHANA